MTSRLRLTLLVLTFAYTFVLGPAHALAARAKAHLGQRTLRENLFSDPGWFSHRVSQPTKTHRAKTLGVRAVSFARHLIGVPYVYGGSSPRSGFDCSGFVRFVYQHFGVQLPHSSYADYNLGRRVSRGGLRPGDLVFFDGLGHVGMYIGNGRFIHAPHTGTRVQISSLEGWYAGRFDGARRLTPA